MAAKDVIDYKLDRLINIMLTDGVQPGDIADNIFLEDYQQITYKKSGDSIIGEIRINESNELEGSYCILRYVYSKEKRIDRIEEEKHGNITIQWDRAEIVSDLINDIVDLLKIHYTENQMGNFLKSLPTDIYEKIACRLNEVA